MPVWNEISGSWSTSVDWGSGTWWVFNQLNKKYNLGVTPSSLMCGTPADIVHKIDNLNANFSIDGPVMFMMTQGAWGGPRWTQMNPNIYQTAFPGDAYSYAIYMILYMGWNYLIKNLKFSIDESSGASVSLDWVHDPPPWGPAVSTSGGPGIQGMNPAIPGWLVPWSSLLGPGPYLDIPLRVGAYYDFVVKYGSAGSNFYVPARSVNVTMALGTEDYNPLGGTDIWALAATGAGSIVPDGTMDALMHTPIRMLKNVNLAIDLQFLVIPHETSVTWGKVRDAVGYSYGTSLQNHDIGILDLPSIGVWDTATQNFEFLSSLFVNPFGALIESVDVTYKPGLCSANVRAKMPLTW